MNSSNKDEEELKKGINEKAARNNREIIENVGQILLTTPEQQPRRRRCIHNGYGQGHGHGHHHQWPSRSRSGSWNSKKRAPAYGYGKNHRHLQQMARAGLICSLLLLATICAVHLLSIGTEIHNRGGIDGLLRPSIGPNFVGGKDGKQIDHLVQYRLGQLTREMARLNGGQQNRHVNMLLTERHRRTVQRHPRSPTPIPSVTLARSPLRRQPNSPLYAENLPSPSTSMEIGGEEPTLMDFDAIDAYWRWDIEQEKGPTLLLATQPQQQNYAGIYGYQQQQHGQWPREASTEPAELLFEHDIQLLTEKSQFPELAINPTSESHVDDEYSLTDLSQHNTHGNGKWEVLQSQWWPTTSSTTKEDEKQQETTEQPAYYWPEQPAFSWPNNLGGARSDKFLPLSNLQTAQGNNNEDEGIGTELLNIPIATPPPSSTTEEPDTDIPFGVPTTSSICPHFPDIPSPITQQQQPEGPILFNDVSLAFAIGTDDDEAMAQIQTAAEIHPTTSNSLHLENNEENDTKLTDTEEAEEDMLLSTLFPELFPPVVTPPIYAANPNSLLRSPSLNSVLSNIANNSNVEVILRELATAELLLNATIQQQQQQQLAAQMALSPRIQLPLAPAPLAIQTIPNPFQYGDIGAANLLASPSNPTHQQQPQLFAPSTDHDFYCLPRNAAAGNGTSQISPRCSSTTSSGFGSSGADTLASYSPSYLYGHGLQQEDSNPPASVAAFRYENKLVPVAEQKLKQKKAKMNGEQGGTELPKAKGKRGRRSKDELLANQHGLPYTAEHLAAMPYREYAFLMQNDRLTADQKAMIKKIRRRGRNKLAARKCRERRMGKKGDGYEEDDTEEDFEDEEEDIDVGSFEPQQFYYPQHNSYGGECEEEEDEDEPYDPAGISLRPSTSAQMPQHRPSQQQQFPNKMASGMNLRQLHREQQQQMNIQRKPQHSIRLNV